VSETGDEVTKN